MMTKYYSIIENLNQRIFSSEMRKLINLALPIIAANILQMAYNLVDMIWVGRLGSDAVAAVGSAGFFLNFSWALATIITMGVNVKVAHAFGAKNTKDTAIYASSGLFGVAILGIIYFSIIFTTAPQLISFYELRNIFVEAQASTYLRISVFGSLLTFFNLFFVSLLNAHGYTKLSFRASLVGTIMNLVLDPIFIFGFGWGVEGAAYATVLSTFSSTLFFLYLIYGKRVVSFGNYIFSGKHLKDITQIGLPASLQRILFIVIYIFVAKIIAEWGATAIAVQKIGVQIEAITYMLVGGLSQAMAIATGQLYGASNYMGIRKVFNAGVKMAFSVGIFNTILFLLIPDFLFSVFLSEPESVEMGVSYLRILAFSQIFMCVEMLVTGAYNGLGKTYIPAGVSVIFTALRVPAAYLLGTFTFLGLDGVWWSISGSSILKGVIIFMLIRLTLYYLLDDVAIDRKGKGFACLIKVNQEKELGT